jgi:hypothetical protein
LLHDERIVTDTVVGAAGAAGVDARVGVGDEYEDDDEDGDDDIALSSSDDDDGDADGPAGCAPPCGGMMHAVAATEKRAAARTDLIIMSVQTKGAPRSRIRVVSPGWPWP